MDTPDDQQPLLKKQKIPTSSMATHTRRKTFHKKWGRKKQWNNFLDYCHDADCAQHDKLREKQRCLRHELKKKANRIDIRATMAQFILEKQAPEIKTQYLIAAAKASCAEAAEFIVAQAKNQGQQHAVVNGTFRRIENQELHTGTKTALHLAAWNGSLEVATILLNNGANPNSGGRNNKPLHFALCQAESATNHSSPTPPKKITQNHLAIARLLLEREANVDAPGRENNLAIDIVLYCIPPGTTTAVHQALELLLEFDASLDKSERNPFDQLYGWYDHAIQPSNYSRPYTSNEKHEFITMMKLLVEHGVKTKSTDPKIQKLYRTIKDKVSEEESICTSSQGLNSLEKFELEEAESHKSLCCRLF